MGSIVSHPDESPVIFHVVYLYCFKQKVVIIIFIYDPNKIVYIENELYYSIMYPNYKSEKTIGLTCTNENKTPN